jgi:hypothetical protein
VFFFVCFCKKKFRDCFFFLSSLDKKFWRVFYQKNLDKTISPFISLSLSRTPPPQRKWERETIHAHKENALLWERSRE